MVVAVGVGEVVGSEGGKVILWSSARIEKRLCFLEVGESWVRSVFEDCGGRLRPRDTTSQVGDVLCSAERVDFHFVPSGLRKERDFVASLFSSTLKGPGVVGSVGVTAWWSMGSCSSALLIRMASCRYCIVAASQSLGKT